MKFKIFSKNLICVISTYILISLSIICAFGYENCQTVNVNGDNYNDLPSYYIEKIIENDVNIEYDSIENINNSRRSLANTENIPPVAGLQYVVLNPDTLLNGNITTNTQIAWLWSYNDKDYTYDPDGNGISEILLDCIPNVNPVIGYIKSNDGSKNIGFVTQFTTPAQYQMNYQVKDGLGALSNKLQYILNIEPSDGTNRPVCQIICAPTNREVRVKHPAILSWKLSYDNDENDTIKDFDLLVYKKNNLGGTAAQADVSFNNEEQQCTLTFNEEGLYELWTRVVDNTGAWSDWSIIEMNVLTNQIEFQDIKISTYFDGDIPDRPEYRGTYWIDYAKSKVLANQYPESPDTPPKIINSLGSKNYPSSLPNNQLNTELEISGVAKYVDGIPAQNETVQVYMPMTQGKKLEVFLKTDSEGRFNYTANGTEYWTNMGYIPSVANIKWYSGDISGNEANMCYFSGIGNSFYYPTEVTISIPKLGLSYSEPVAAVAGYSHYPIMGGKYRLYDSDGDYIVEWVYEQL